MDENMIHRYFSESPFFDWTSKNGLLLDQSKADQFTLNMVHNRQAFEENLRTRSGLEFMIVDDPKPVADKAMADRGVKTGIYVIRKQDRREAPMQPHIRPPHVLVEKDPDGQPKWELTVLGTYFVVGESVYQAPSVFDVISNHLLSTASSLHNFFDIADDLPRFTPAMGHHYLPPQAPKPSTSSGSVDGTPRGSRETSLAPGVDATSGSAATESQVTDATVSTNARDNQLLFESLETFKNWGDNFVDENPLVGDPDNFRFTFSTAAVKKRRADEEAAAAKARAEKESASTSRVMTPKPEKAPTPPNVFSTDAKANAKAEKGNKDERRQNKAEKRRRKSRHGGTATSPTTPSSATTPQAPLSAS